jgi:hypothetical protein
MPYDYDLVISFPDTEDPTDLINADLPRQRARAQSVTRAVGG